MWASIDIGTNSTRLLIAEKDKSTGRVLAVRRMLRTTRTGESLIGTRLIQRAAEERILTALAEYQKVAAEYRPKKFFLIGTQALRQAANSEELAARILERYGWDLEVISGEKEARLSYLGAVRGLQGLAKPLVIDIGGGSTEFVYMGAKGELEAWSLPLGALRHLENPVPYKALQEQLVFGLKKRDIPTESLLVGVGGTCTTAAAVRLGLSVYNPSLVQGLRITEPEILAIYTELLGKTPSERLTVPGLCKGREDIIVPGLEILLAVLKCLQKTSLVISDEDLLFGVIYEYLLNRGEDDTIKI